MRPKIIFLLLALVVIGGGAWYFRQPTQASSGGESGDDEKPSETGGTEKTIITAQAAADAGIAVEQAGTAVVRDMVDLSGRVTLNPNTTANVKARFPGIVRSVAKGLGERVTNGETLATVESNDSLLAYPVKAPIGGVVLQRNTNIGDVAADQPMFVLANLDSVWVELFLFPRDLDRVKVGQQVMIQSTDSTVRTETTISSLLPVTESYSQTVVARAVLANPRLEWRAGMTVGGKVVVAEKSVPIAVATGAIQQLDGASVVFVREGESYTARKVETGATDSERTEIRSGLSAGETYVSKGSFVVKADLGKSGLGEEE